MLGTRFVCNLSQRTQAREKLGFDVTRIRFDDWFRENRAHALWFLLVVFCKRYFQML